MKLIKNVSRYTSVRSVEREETTYELVGFKLNYWYLFGLFLIVHSFVISCSAASLLFNI